MTASRDNYLAAHLALAEVLESAQKGAIKDVLVVADVGHATYAFFDAGLELVVCSPALSQPNENGIPFDPYAGTWFSPEDADMSDDDYDEATCTIESVLADGSPGLEFVNLSPEGFTLSSEGWEELGYETRPFV